VKYSLLDRFQMTTLASWSWFERVGHHAVGIECSVVTFILLHFMEEPILIKILTGAQCAQAQHGFSTSQTPAGAGHLHAVFDQMSTGALDDSSRNGKALRKIAIIAQIGRVVDQVAGASIYGFALFGGKRSQSRAATYSSGHEAGLSPQDFKEPMLNPAFQFRSRCGVKRSAGIPQVLDDMNDIDDDRQIETVLFGQATRASINKSLMTSSGVFSILAQTRFFSGRGRGGPALEELL